MQRSDIATRTISYDSVTLLALNSIVHERTVHVFLVIALNLVQQALPYSIMATCWGDTHKTSVIIVVLP